LKDALKQEQAHMLSDEETVLLRKLVAPGGRLNIDQVGKSPSTIATMAGFSVPESTRALVAIVESVGKTEPLSMETLSPILSMYSVEGWEEGCERCKEILAFGGIGHTLAIHASSKKVIEAFALEKPAMRIVVNTVAALGSVGFTTDLFPAMTLGPGTIGGSITSDNISPLHLINIKRLAFETNAVNPTNAAKLIQVPDKPRYVQPVTPLTQDGRPSKPWMDEIEARLRTRAGNPKSNWQANRSSGTKAKGPSSAPSDAKSGKASEKKPDVPSLSESDVERIAAKFRKR